MAGWQWIWIMEGIIAVLVAVLAFFILEDYPDTAKCELTSSHVLEPMLTVLDSPYPRRARACRPALS